MTQDPMIQVIIMSVQGETDYMRRAMLAGAREFLTKPISADDLYKSIRHVHRLRSTRPTMVQKPGMSGGDGASGDGGSSQGQLIAVFSPKGGVGTSVVAANLAVALRLLTNKKVALVDANFMFGDMAVMMNLASNKTVIDLANRIDDLDRELLNDVLTTHTSQVKVLLAPPNPQAGELVTADHLKAILDLMRQEFDFVIVDTESSIQDRAITVLDTADRIVALMTLELTCIKNIKLFLEVAELLEYPDEKIILVLNKADNRLGIRVENVENNIQHKVAIQIANSAQDVTLSINQGVPLVIEKRSHQMSKDIFGLAATLTNVARAAEKAKAAAAQPAQQAKTAENRGGLFSRLTGKR